VIRHPKILQCDNGGEFKSVLLQLVKEKGALIINGRPRHPQSQGMVEQANGMVKGKLRAWKLETGKSTWASALPRIALQMNTQPHSKLPRSRTPFDIFFGRSPRWGGYVPFAT
jgi:transposase InsO family protein